METPLVVVGVKETRHTAIDRVDLRGHEKL